MIICAGREKQIALEDAYTAGRIVRAARKGLRKIVLNDSADVALGLAQRYRGWLDAFTTSESGRALQALGLEQDVQFCADADKYDLVPTYSDRLIT